MDMGDRDSENASETHFGYRRVAAADKTGLVADVFRSVATRYDLMNDLMSLGAHRLWKRFAVGQSGVCRGQRVLDVAGGTGDLAARFANRVGPTGQIVLSDINDAMLEQGRSRLLDKGLTANIAYVRTNAESLAFSDQSFHCVSIGFGLRNVTEIDKALTSMFRILRPAGRVLILEFSRPVLPLLSKLYDAYSFAVIPCLGRLVADNEASYRYLVESIRRHPDQDTLKTMMETVGFERVRYFNLSGGIVALHIGERL